MCHCQDNHLLPKCTIYSLLTHTNIEALPQTCCFLLHNQGGKKLTFRGPWLQGPPCGWKRHCIHKHNRGRYEWFRYFHYFMPWFLRQPPPRQGGPTSLITWGSTRPSSAPGGNTGFQTSEVFLCGVSVFFSGSSDFLLQSKHLPTQPIHRTKLAVSGSVNVCCDPTLTLRRPGETHNTLRPPSTG